MLVLINKIAMLSDLGTVSTGTSAPLVAFAVEAGSTNTRFLSKKYVFYNQTLRVYLRYFLLIL